MRSKLLAPARVVIMKLSEVLIRWTIEDANKFLANNKKVFEKAGYKARIIGSVAEIGYSDHDLDVLLTPTRALFDFEVIMEQFPGDFTMEMDTYESGDEYGRIIDFWFGEPKDIGPY